MKRTGLMAVAVAAVMTVACGGGDREAADNATTNDIAAQNGSIGTAGEGGAVGGDMTNRARGTGDVQDFVHEAAMHGTAEVELGKIAAERATNAEVKQFGQMMVRDHTKANEELISAVKGQVQVQPMLDEKHKDLAERLRTLNGAEFDREYMNAMVDGHEQVKDMLEDKADDAGQSNTAGTAGSANNTNGSANRPAAGADASGVDMAVSQWAAKTLPAVTQHLERARQIRERLNNNRNSTN